MHLVTYEETLDKVEEFMRKSDLRDFCSDICQGCCCSDCFTSKNACHKNEGRRLSCSAYLCLNLKTLVLNNEEIEIYSSFERSLTTNLQAVAFDSEKIYFSPHSEYMKKAFSMKQTYLDKLNKINIENVRERVSALKSMHIKLSRFLVKKIESMETK